MILAAVTKKLTKNSYLTTILTTKGEVKHLCVLKHHKDPIPQLRTTAQGDLYCDGCLGILLMVEDS